MGWVQLVHGTELNGMTRSVGREMGEGVTGLTLVNDSYFIPNN